MSVQCQAIAKATGVQCQLDAVGWTRAGRPCCGYHTYATRVIASPELRIAELERTVDELTNKLSRAEQELKTSASRIAELEKKPESVVDKPWLWWR